MNPWQAMILLEKCRGDEVWSVQLCRQSGVPETWIDELADAYESGFDHDQNTLYENGRQVNQYHGVSDLKLAYKIAEFLNIDWEQATQFAFSRTSQVDAIKLAAEDL